MKRLLLVLLMGVFISTAQHHVLAQKCFDFEDGNLPPEFSLSQNSAWKITSQSIDGGYSLADSVAPSNKAVSESFSFSLPHSVQAIADTFSISLKFTYGTGETAVVSTNRFGVFVGANIGNPDSISFANEKLQSFVLTFNGTRGDDTLRLFYLQNKKLTPVISTQARCNGTTLAVRLIRSVQGTLTLLVGTDGSFDNMQSYIAGNSSCDFAGNGIGVHLVTSTAKNNKCLVLDNIEATFAPRQRYVLPSGAVVINEVLFNPYTGGVDFVELYNCSNAVVNLKGCSIANRKIETGVIDKSYTLPNYSLLPNKYVAVTTKPDVVQAQYFCENTDAFIALATMPSYPNEEGCVTLLNTDGTLLEDFYYSDKMHNDVLVDTKGVSLERINPNRAASEGANWTSAAQEVGFATPTYKNSQYSTHDFKGSDVVSISPEVFSPDGDGVDDMLFIGYRMPAEGYIANITIFTSAGKVAKILCRNTTLAVEGQLSWDGVCDNGKRADVGIYLVLVEAFSLSGKVNRYKKTCVVGARF